MTQATETTRPATDAGTIDLTDDALRTRALAKAQVLLKGHSTGIEGREDEFARAIADIHRTFDHTQGYQHQVNDALVKMWLSSIKFAAKHDLLEDYVAESVLIMDPILQRMAGIIRASGEREVALEAICGWSTCHHQLVLSDTHKTAGTRTFVSPFEPVLSAGRRIRQWDFDEAFVVEQFFIPRAVGFGEVLGVPVTGTFEPTTRMITIALTD
jgi:hypothetical protein